MPRPITEPRPIRLTEPQWDILCGLANGLSALTMLVGRSITSMHALVDRGLVRRILLGEIGRRSYDFEITAAGRRRVAQGRHGELCMAAAQVRS